MHGRRRRRSPLHSDGMSWGERMGMIWKKNGEDEETSESPKVAANKNTMSAQEGAKKAAEAAEAAKAGMQSTEKHDTTHSHPPAAFESEEEVIEMANSTKYGLSASIFTENISKGHRVAANIDAGVVWINTWLLRDLRIPFGGMKQSGVGREGGFKSLHFFTEPKNVCVKI